MVYVSHVKTHDSIVTNAFLCDYKYCVLCVSIYHSNPGAVFLNFLQDFIHDNEKSLVISILIMMTWSTTIQLYGKLLAVRILESLSPCLQGCQNLLEQPLILLLLIMNQDAQMTSTDTVELKAEIMDEIFKKYRMSN